MKITYRLSFEVSRERRAAALAWSRQQADGGSVECESQTLVLTAAVSCALLSMALQAWLQPGEHAHVYVVSGDGAGQAFFAHGAPVENPVARCGYCGYYFNRQRDGSPIVVDGPPEKPPWAEDVARRLNELRPTDPYPPGTCAPFVESGLINGTYPTILRDLGDEDVRPQQPVTDEPSGQVITGTWQTDLRDYDDEVVWSHSVQLPMQRLRGGVGQECSHALLPSQVRDSWAIGSALTGVTNEPTGLEAVDVSQSGLSAGFPERGFGPKFDQIVDYAARLHSPDSGSSDYEVVPATDSPPDRLAARLVGAALGLAVASDDVGGRKEKDHAT